MEFKIWLIVAIIILVLSCGSIYIFQSKDVIQISLLQLPQNEHLSTKNSPTHQSIISHTFTNISQLLYSHNDSIDPSASECGRYWLYRNKGIILSITSISINQIVINNINPNISYCNASRITIYITIHGDELLGGLAMPHATKCQWSYSYVIRISDTYTISAKLLYYDGELDANYTKCNIQTNKIPYNSNTTKFDGNHLYIDDQHILTRIKSPVKCKNE